MENAIELTLNGLMLGSLYALFALGLSLSLGVMRMINLAHGDFIVLGAFAASVAMAWFKVSALWSILLVVPAMFLVGWVLQFALLNRVVGTGELSPLLVTFGLSIVIQNLLLEGFTGNTRSLNAGELALSGIRLGDISVGILPLLITLVSVGLYAATSALVSRTHWGRQARAVADDPATARLVGVNDQRFFALMAGFVMAATAVAAVLYGIRTPFTPTAGPERLLFAFEAVVLGGIGRLWGSLLGGLLIGLAQVFGTQIDSGLGAFFAHLFFLLALLIRPQGLLPNRMH